MKKNTVLTGLVLRETPQGEYNKLINILTAEQGLVSVYCYGTKSIKSKNLASTMPLCYSELEVAESNSMYILKNGTIITNFNKYNLNLVQSSLIMYCTEVLLYVCCENNNEDEMLRLALNIFYAIANDLKTPQQIKGVFDLRCCLNLGFTPQTDGCIECGSEISRFDYRDGCGYCKKHCTETCSHITTVSSQCISAMQYVLCCHPKKILSFNLSEEYIEEFSKICEKYLEYQVEHKFKSLDFYHTSLKMSL